MLVLEGILHPEVIFFIIEKYVILKMPIAAILIGISYSFKKDTVVVPAMPNNETIEKPTLLQLVQIPEPAPNAELIIPTPSFFELFFIILI